MSRYKKHNCVSSPKEAEAVSNRNREDRRKKIGTKDPLVQTTKRLFDVGDEERHQHYQEAYLEAWKGRIARESVAADSEYYKFTLDPPPDNHMRTPQQGDSFYYIPEQHLQWTWREGRLKKRDPNIVVMVEETSPTSRPHLQTSVKHKYAFDNGIYKILIR